MFNAISNHKVILFWSIFTMLICSVTITLVSKNTLADSLSMTVTVFACLGLFFTAATLLEDKVHEICNP
ncbi:hypothetical protein [Acinetobacter bouvetii]|uniref:Uncharacterized protein n=1 Tax=Acinetobacter bouvetii TaxID=202951 RepID=A0A811GCS7_9GAMM|nr:hypothetical protein [Acinetobacter bouvetii]CAB1218743.1 hypothetical protein SFB21_2313 [Acinetobacter bouvetii]